jgi:hypothetical protein
MLLAKSVEYWLPAWLLICLLSSLYVGIDQFRGNPEPPVMKWGFVLVTLYLGLFGVLLYVLADKEPRPGEHESFTAPLWKQAVGSTVHCVAGDATGIILAAVITGVLGLPMRLDLLIEYLSGLFCGLLIFQALFMRSMMGGTYLENVRRTFMAEFVSMNFMMAGMATVMSFFMSDGAGLGMQPNQLSFWGVMSLGVTVGFAFAYPANVWLVAKDLKHGLMTVRPSLPEHHMHHNKAASNVTVPQLTAVTLVSTLVLAMGLLAA